MPQLVLNAILIGLICLAYLWYLTRYDKYHSVNEEKELLHQDAKENRERVRKAAGAYNCGAEDIFMAAARWWGVKPQDAYACYLVFEKYGKLPIFVRRWLQKYG